MVCAILVPKYGYLWFKLYAIFKISASTISKIAIKTQKSRQNAKTFCDDTQPTFYGYIRYRLGWLSRFELPLRVPQTPVLPLHHSHHIVFVSPVGIEPTVNCFEGRYVIRYTTGTGTINLPF